jgi:lipooligosaccharide transport system permease protein
MNPIREDKISVVHSWRMTRQIWRRNFIQFQRSWKISLVWIVIEPILILAAMGFGLGSFISTMGGVSYAEFFYPALLCTTSMLVAYFVATYDNYSRLTHQRVFSSLILTPIEPKEIVYGEILWAGTKGLISAIGVTLVAGAFGMVETIRIFPALAAVFLSALVFAAFGMVVTTWVKNFDQIIYPTSAVVIPMSLFSGTYFPIDNLPYGLHYLAYVSPLTHAVRVVRGLLLTGFDWWMVGNIAYLLVLLVVLLRLASLRLTIKLLD